MAYGGPARIYLRDQGTMTCNGVHNPWSASMDSGLMASPTYQNLFASRRPPPPPPDRSPSPDEKPPALPPRNYRRHSEGHVLSQRTSVMDHEAPSTMDDANIDRSKRDFGDLKRQFENTNSPREDAYIEKVRMEARRRMSAQSAQSAQPMTLKYTKPDISFSKTMKREPMVPQEATLPETSPPSEHPATRSVLKSVEEANKENSAPSNNSNFSAKSGRERTLSDIPPPSPPKVSDAELVSDGEELPPPPPDLMDTEDGEKHDGYADDSYMSAACQRRSRRNSGGAGNYKRSASAAALRNENEDTEVTVTDASHVFSDKKLGHQNWNSESALTRHSLTASLGRDTSPNIPAFKADVVQVRNVSKETVQPLQASAMSPQSSLSLPYSSVSKPAKPPQTLSTTSVATSSRGGVPRLPSPSSGAGKPLAQSPVSSASRTISQPQTTASARSANQPSPTTVSGVSISVVKPVQSPSTSGTRTVTAVQSPSGATKTSIFSPRPFVSHYSQPKEGEGVEGKKFGTPNSVRDRISRLENRETKHPVMSPRLEPNKTVSPKHTASPKPVDSSWKTNSVQMRTSSPKTVDGHLKAESSWETMENLSQSSLHKGNENSQNSQRILESWRDDRSRYPRNESFSSSSTSSSVSSSDRRQAPRDFPSNSRDVPPHSATSPQQQRYRNYKPTDSSAGDGRSPKAAPGHNPNQSAYNQRDSRPQRFPSGAHRNHEDVSSPRGKDQSRLSSADSSSMSPSYRESRDSRQPREQDSNGFHARDSELYSPRMKHQSGQHKNVHNQSQAQSATNNISVQKDIYQTDSQKPKDDNRLQSTNNSQVEGENQSRVKSEMIDLPQVQHGRQRSQEEIECDAQAKQLAQELKDSDKKLSEVLTQDHKRMAYMDGMFVQSSELNRRPSSGKLSPKGDNSSPDRRESFESEKSRGALPATYFKPSSKALVEMELRRNEEVNKDLIKDVQDKDALKKQKEELMEKLYSKSKILKEEKLMLQQEIDENEELGKKVCETVERQGRTQAEKDKFSRYIDELEKIVRLMLNLSGQLARAENAVQSLGANTDAKLRKMTIDKRERLHSKYQDAKSLKEDIDQRSESVSAMLRNVLTDEEFDDYSYFIKMKSKLTIDCQDLDDKITLGEEQIQELKKSIPDN